MGRSKKTCPYNKKNQNSLVLLENYSYICIENSLKYKKLDGFSNVKNTQLNNKEVVLIYV